MLKTLSNKYRIILANLNLILLDLNTIILGKVGNNFKGDSPLRLPTCEHIKDELARLNKTLINARDLNDQ